MDWVTPGTWRYAGLALAGALVALAFSPAASVVLAATAGFVVLFHRDPDRDPPGSGVLAPADGRVTVVRRERDENGEDGRLRVGIFMGVSNVHVNRAPMGGRVREVTHSSGGHWPAFTKESDRNERVTVDCGEFSVVLIAGAFARRIHPYVAAGARLARGQRIGHISFGSRADVVLPASVSHDDLAVAEGDRVRAGETEIATLPGSG
ncbi:phosphatidylserine decarboxylase [Halobacteriales archaeon QS_1_68_17]|nr:MAG: phosphatidylserine decarboxylase [Halobacteriales archaeon QS_1_68_17]